LDLDRAGALVIMQVLKCWFCCTQNALQRFAEVALSMTNEKLIQTSIKI
jgi:hypothetical protein